MDQWIKPHVDIANWEFYDLSCKSRDNTDDKVLSDSVNAGKRLGSIFKEPTVTPSAAQAKQWGLKKAWGSPNGAMRRGWNGITISRDTIHIEGVKLGFDKPVFFEVRIVQLFSTGIVFYCTVVLSTLLIYTIYIYIYIYIYLVRH